MDEIIPRVIQGYELTRVQDNGDFTVPLTNCILPFRYPWKRGIHFLENYVILNT
jgi:hypothetical protein